MHLSPSPACALVPAIGLTPRYIINGVTDFGNEFVQLGIGKAQLDGPTLDVVVRNVGADSQNR